MSKWKRVRSDDHCWELSGESVLNVELLADEPKSGQATIRLTHSNIYCPIEGVELSIRVGDMDNPTSWDEAHLLEDWINVELVEELLLIDDNEVERSTITTALDMEEETPWDATYDSILNLSKGEKLIEIKVASKDEYFMSGIIPWYVEI